MAPTKDLPRSPIADGVIAALDKLPFSNLRQQVSELGIHGVNRSQFVYSATKAIEIRISDRPELRELWFFLGAARERLADEMREQYEAMGMPEMIARMGMHK